MAAAPTVTRPLHPTGWLALFMGLWIVAVALQAFNGAWTADFGAHPDEAAHVVTGLMVRDFLAGGFLVEAHPMRFAEAYYDHFPKVALGHYPPGFYLSEALFLLPRPSTGAVLLHLSAIGAALAVLTFAIGRRLTGNPALAFVAALVLLLLPVVQRYTSVIMADLLVALLMLASAAAFARFLGSGRARDSLLFGFLAAATILTKGSGLLLALLPPLAIALSGRWHLLKKPALWLAPLPVLLLALPWMWFTHDISAEGMRGVPLMRHVREALTFYPGHVPGMLGWAWTFFAVVGVLRALVPGPSHFNRPVTASLLALVLALYFFHVGCPIGLEDRYLLPALAPLLLIAITAAQAVFRAAALPKRALWVPAAILFSLALLEIIRLNPKEDRSFNVLASRLQQQQQQQPPAEGSTLNILVSSDARGEGALIAAMALELDRRSPSPVRVLRSSKELASSDWMGRDYQLAASSPRQVESLLAELEVDAVVIDPGLPDRTRRPHHELMLDWWDQYHRGQGEKAAPAEGSPVLVWR